MTDREKVIKGLETCYRPPAECEDCPYHDLLDEQSCNDALCLDALFILKEQEAVPVIKREIMHMLFWCCGSCGVAITDGDKFCRNCGKEVKWNGGNDL